MDDGIVARRAVLARHARLQDNGHPAFCQPSQKERSGAKARKAAPKADGKVIYPNRKAAEAAAAEFEQLDGSASHPYPCGRSRRGHWHLTTSVITVALPESEAVTRG